jgi:hypothetical protein
VCRWPSHPKRALLYAAFLGSSGLLLLVFIRNGPFGGMACIPSTSQGRECCFIHSLGLPTGLAPRLCATEAPVNPRTAAPGRSAELSAGRRWLSGAAQKRGAYQPGLNTHPSALGHRRECAGYHFSPLAKKRAFTCRAPRPEETNENGEQPAGQSIRSLQRPMPGQ